MGTHFTGTKTEVDALNAFIKLMRATDTVEPVPSSRIWKRGVQDDMRCGQMAVRAGGV